MEQKNLGPGKRYLSGLNCAESVLQQANADYDLGLTPEALKIATGFGSGMGCGLTCGAISASVMVISCLYGRNSPEDNGVKAKKLTHRFIKGFQEKYHGLECSQLISVHRHPQDRCSGLVDGTYAVLQEILAEAENLK